MNCRQSYRTNVAAWLGMLLCFATGCGTRAGAEALRGGDAASCELCSALARTPSTGLRTLTVALADTAGQGDRPASTATGGAKIAGRVLYEGDPPKRRVINTAKDPQCAKLHGDKPVLDEDLIVTDGGLANAFVFVRRGAPKSTDPPPEKPAELNQRGCMFHPRVQAIRVGQKLLVGNADPVTHNVRSFPALNAAFNFGQPPDTPPRQRLFDKAEREIEVQCDIHPWMHAYIFVMEHPYYCVSADKGAYSIDGLPPGEYMLECWHEKLGRQRKTITMGTSALADVDFTFKP